METSKFPNLSKIAEDWDEEYYRQRPELSYSQLSKFARNGFEGYLALANKEESASLTFGSAVDCILTDGDEAFRKKYVVSDCILTAGKTKDVIDNLAMCSSAQTMDGCTSTDWKVALESAQYYNNLTIHSRIEKFRDVSGFIPLYKNYYVLLKSKGDKTVLSTEVASRVNMCCASVRTNNVAKHWFIKDIFGNTEIFHQLKFKANLDGIDYRCMADAILVNHDNKTIYPLDLKTSSKQVYDFPLSFVEWRYDIQARLYWRIINSCVKHSKEFFDYSVANYMFAVVNSTNAKCMCWTFPDTKSTGTLIYGENKDIVLKDPFFYGKQLRKLIDTNAECPLGLYFNKPNNIVEFFEKR